MWAYGAYVSAYITMYVACVAFKLKAYNKYTGWIRLQMFACLPLLPDPLARDLLWNNAFGCLFAIHFIYSLDHYNLLSVLADRSLKTWGIKKSTFVVHLTADFLVHGLPAMLVLLVLRQSNIEYIGQPYVWLLTGIPHSTYCYVLTGTWDPTAFYEVEKYPLWKTLAVWPAILLGHYVAFCVRPYWMLT